MIEIACLHVQVMRLQVAVLRRERIDAVVRSDDGLRVLKLGEHARRKDVFMVRCVALAGAQRLPIRCWPSGKQRDVGISSRFRDGVVRLQLLMSVRQPQPCI